MYPIFLRVTKVYINGSCRGIFIVSHINEVPVAVRSLYEGSCLEITYSIAPEVSVNYTAAFP